MKALEHVEIIASQDGGSVYKRPSQAGALLAK